MSENPHDIPYSYLYYFSVIATEGNLTRAAERLYKTQPSLAVAMKTLEAALGFSLFEHHSHRLILNEAGKCLLEYVNSGLILFEDGVREARKIADSRDVVRIATSMGIVRNIAAGYESGSGMRVEVITCDTEEVLSRVFSGKADIGVNFGFIQDGRVTSRTLMLGPYCVAVNRAHPLSSQRAVTLQELEKYQLFCSDIAHTREKVTELFERAKCKPKLLVLDEKDLLFRAVELGLGGVICLPMMAVHNNDQDIVFIPIRGCDTLAASVLITKSGSYLSSEVMSLIDYLTAEFARNQDMLNRELLEARRWHHLPLDEQEEANKNTLR